MHFPKGNFPNDNFPNGNFPNVHLPKWTFSQMTISQVEIWWMGQTVLWLRTPRRERNGVWIEWLENKRTRSECPALHPCTTVFLLGLGVVLLFKIVYFFFSHEELLFIRNKAKPLSLTCSYFFKSFIPFVPMKERLFPRNDGQP